MTVTQPRATRHVVAASFLALSAASLPGQDVEFIAITKAQNFVQHGSHTVGLLDPDDLGGDEFPFVFDAFADTPDPGLLQGATLSLPGGGDVALEPDFDDGSWGRVDSFENFALMQGSYPAGSYQLELMTTNDGTRTVELALPETGYLGITNFTVFPEAQMIDPSRDFTVRWNPIPGGNGDDVVILELFGEFGVFFSSPDLGEPGQLTGRSTEFTIPAGTLESGQEYTAGLLMFHPVDEDDSYPGVFTVSALGKSLSMPLRTTGGTDFDPPGLEFSAPFPGEIGVETNSQVVFTFSEPMDSGVDPSGAITWTGLPNPSLMNYTWSADGHRLFCSYGPGLPTDTTVQWMLNPAGASTRLRDEAGNELAGGISSDFSTSETSNTGEPDVLLAQLGKLKSFRQDGPTAVDQHAYFAGFFAELSGIGTVTRLDLDIPGRGVETNVGEYYFDFRELESEVSFAEADDLDRIFPPGEYELVFQTAHDGEQTMRLAIGAGNYPNAPTVLDFAATQAIDGSKPFTVRWDPMTGGTSADFIELFIEGELACYFETPFAGEPGALDGTATSVTIPAGYLPPGRTLECELAFVRVTDSDETSYPGAAGFAGFVSATEFEIRTIGEPMRPQVTVEHGGNQAMVTVTGEVGFLYELRASDDLQNWTPVWTDFIGGECEGFLGSFDFFEDALGAPQRFYQVQQIQVIE